MRQQLSNRDKRELADQLKQLYTKDLLTKKDPAELLDSDGMKVLVINRVVSFFWSGDAWLPTLRLLLKDNFLPKAVVDMGAVRFVASGADIMRPGIVSMDPCGERQVISVVDAAYGRPLAVGRALGPSASLLALKQGKCIANLHHVGDAIWKLQDQSDA